MVKKRNNNNNNKQTNKEHRTKEREGEFFSILTKQANGEMAFHLNFMIPQSSSAVDRHYIYELHSTNQYLNQQQFFSDSFQFCESIHLIK